MSDTCCHGACDPDGAAASPAAGSADARLWRVLASASAIAGGALAASAGGRGASLVLYLAAIGVASVVPAQRAWRSLRARVLDINVLMVVAVAGAAALGDWLEAAVVVWLFGVAQWLESRSTRRAQRAIRALLTLAPDRALVRRDGREVTADVAGIRRGEVVVVRPGERIAVDGVVVAGASDVDQSTITGESWPAGKLPGDDVFAGTINGQGALEVETLREPSNSTLARIVRLVDRAQRERAPVQGWVDRFARRYTPAVLLLAVAVAVVPPLVWGGAASFSTWVYRALTLIVVACPCALVISTPVSIVSALTVGARRACSSRPGRTSSAWDRSAASRSTRPAR